MKFGSAFLVLIPLVLAGCAAKVVKGAPDPSMAKLADAAVQVQDAWKTIGAIEQAKQPQHLALIEKTAVTSTDALDKRISAPIEGDLEPVIRNLMKDRKISVFVVNRRPAHGVPVVGNFVEARLIDVLRDLGYQAGNKATVKVNAVDGAEFVEIVYAPQ